MASFMANLFPGGKQDKLGIESRPETPTAGKNNFLTPIATPQGSPSKKTAPPGANELPIAFESMRLDAGALDSPLKLGRPQSAVTPLSPGKSNVMPVDDSTFVDESVLHKGATTPGSPVRKQGKENTPPPPAARLAPPEPVYQHNQAALSRQELYSRPLTPNTKKFNTSRGLTPEELEILQRPNVKRLVNVTQLCWFLPDTGLVLSVADRKQTSSITTSTCSPTSEVARTASMPSRQRTPRRPRPTKRCTTSGGTSIGDGSGLISASVASVFAMPTSRS